MQIIRRQVPNHGFGLSVLREEILMSDDTDRARMMLHDNLGTGSGIRDTEQARSVSLVIPGKPIAKARPRFCRRGKSVKTYDVQETEASRFMLLAKEQLNGHQPIEDGPISLTLCFEMPRPKGHYGSGRNAHKLKPSAPAHHTSTPDVDNLVKFVKDCLNELAWRDDCQVVSIQALKRYSAEPKTVINIMPAGAI